MKNNEVFRSHLATHWYVYVAYAIVAVILWSYAVTLFTRDKPEEVVTVWVLSYDTDVLELTERLEKDKPDRLKHVRVSFYRRDDAYAYTVYLGSGSDMDVLILPESFIAENEIASRYLVLDTEYLKSLFGELDFYYREQNAYGIKIHDKAVDASGCIMYNKTDAENEDYYLLVNPKSVQMGYLNGSELSGGIDVIGSLLRYESVLQK